MRVPRPQRIRWIRAPIPVIREGRVALRYKSADVMLDNWMLE